MGKNVAKIIEEKKQPEVASVPNIKKYGNAIWLAVVTVLIILGLTGAGFLLLQQLHDKQQYLGGILSNNSQQMQELTKQISAYQAQLVAIQKQLSSLNVEVGSKDTHFANKLNKLSTLHGERLDISTKHLKESIQHIQRQLGKTRGDWLVADAEYLLSVANRRLHLIGDVSTTLEALKAADNRLRESGDTASFKVRGQIAKEISWVKKVKVADIVGIYSTLEILEENVAKLSLFLPYSGKAKDQQSMRKASVTETNKKPKSANDINDILNNVLVEIEGVVMIRRTDHPATSILSQEQKAFISEQLRTKLVIVKLALMQHDDALYQAGIADTQQWLSQNFTQDAEYKNFLSELEQLKTIQIKSNFPNISRSLKMLRNIARLRLETDNTLQSGVKTKSLTPLKIQKAQ